MEDLPPLDNFILHKTFAALKHRNFRLFWIGQAISLIGTWMQNIAQAWLVLELTHSAFWPGSSRRYNFCQCYCYLCLPELLVDRLSKKKC